MYKLTMLTDLDELKKYISPDQLPAAYGGTRYEPDPYCTKYVSIISNKQPQGLTNITRSTRAVLFRKSTTFVGS